MSNWRCAGRCSPLGAFHVALRRFPRVADAWLLVKTAYMRSKGCPVGFGTLSSQKSPRGTLNVEVTSMLVGNFLENPKKYPDFDFKPLKNTRIAILRAVLGKIAYIFQKFSKTLKNTKITILYPEKYDEHKVHSLSSGKSYVPRAMLSRLT